MLAVDVISDVICPWCYIGKRRLEKAVAAHGRPVGVRWLPFQLNPQMPKEGVSRREYRTRKFGSWERSLELDAQLAAAGAGEGIHFAFDRMERTPNTDAQRKRLHPKKVKPPQLFKPTVRAVKEIVPNKLIPKLKPLPPQPTTATAAHRHRGG
jgi:predicted DsbA family dithiol-disulfide isomerase